MDDVAQRGNVILLAHFLVQLHQADEHGRHHEDGVDPLRLDQPEEFLRVETGHQHQHAAESPRADAEGIRRRMIERPGQQRPRPGLQAIDHGPHLLGGRALLRRRRVTADALGMARRARGVDHVLRLRNRRSLVRCLVGEPGLEIHGEIRPVEMIGIDPIVRKNFGRGRNAEHGDAGWNSLAQGLQQVGMADQHRGAGILQDVVDLLRLEVPVHRHAIGAESHRRISCLDEGDVVAHQNTDAVALLDAEPVHSAGDARDAFGNFGMRAPALAGDDAEEEG